MAARSPIYLDHHATTPVDPRVIEAMAPYLADDFGNASSASHVYGWRAEEAVAIAREKIAAAIGASDPATLVFTSGTTESDNLALIGLARGYAGRRDHLITTAIEHPAVLDTCRVLEREGCALTVLAVDRDGLVDPATVAAALTDRTLVVSVIAANSEIGVLQPLAEIGRVCAERGVFFHSDAAQAVGKIPVDVDRWGVDLLSFCAHKLYGPKGVGALFVRDRSPRMRLRPLIHGGGHERGLRSGTLPVPLIVGFARAVELCLGDLEAETARVGALRDELWERLEAGLTGVRRNDDPGVRRNDQPGVERNGHPGVRRNGHPGVRRNGHPGVRRNGHPTQRLAGNLSVTFEGVAADTLMLALPDIALSSGSACASGSGEPSPVLLALGLSDPQARGTLRFGLGRSTTREQIQHVARRLVEEVARLRESARR